MIKRTMLRGFWGSFLPKLGFPMPPNFFKLWALFGSYPARLEVSRVRREAVSVSNRRFFSWCFSDRLPLSSQPLQAFGGEITTTCTLFLSSNTMDNANTASADDQVELQHANGQPEASSPALEARGEPPVSPAADSESSVSSRQGSSSSESSRSYQNEQCSFQLFVGDLAKDMTEVSIANNCCCVAFCCSPVLPIPRWTCFMPFLAMVW